MPPAQRWGDTCSGHSCFPPSNVVQSSTNVFINNLGATRITDAVMTHCCLRYNTKIKTNIGDIEVSELFEMFQNHKIFGTDFNIKTKCKDFNSKIKDTNIINVLKTKKVDKLIRITLEDGTFFDVTEDHEVLNDNLEYIKAKDLKIDDIFKNIGIIKLEEPEWVYDITVDDESHNFMLFNSIFLKNCGTCHGRAMAEGSHNVYVNNLKKTYLGHRVDCGGVSVAGSPNVIING